MSIELILQVQEVRFIPKDPNLVNEMFQGFNSVRFSSSLSSLHLSESQLIW